MSKRQKNAEVLKKRLALKSMFKKVVREVIINSQWLEGNEVQRISDTIKKNVVLLVRKRRRVGLLTATVRI